MTQLVTDADPRLSQWLSSLKPSASLFCRAEVQAAWGFSIGPRPMATFHLVTEGEAVLEVDGALEPLHLHPGDFILLPTGAAHGMRDSPRSPLPSLEAAVASGSVDGKWVRFGGDGERTVLICGACHLGSPGTRAGEPLLPTVIRSRLDRDLVDLADAESSGLAPGAEAVLLQLLNLLVVRAVRAHVVENARDGLQALFTPEVGRAIGHVHEHLGDEITLEDLCRVAALSRTTLYERFEHAVGVAPMEYVRRTRLHRASELLRTTSAGLTRIARSVGYRSSSTFSRAFRRMYGVPPGAYRASRESD